MMVGNMYLAWGHMFFSFIPGALHAGNRTQVLNKCNCSEALSRLFSNKDILLVNLVIKAVSLKIYFYLCYVYECFAGRHVCAPRACLWFTEGRGGHGIPWHWSHRVL